MFAVGRKSAFLLHFEKTGFFLMCLTMIGQCMHSDAHH
jgi:hypothetical protein